MEITIENSTSKDISFAHQLKSVSLGSIPVKSGLTAVIKTSAVSQTNEQYLLQDSKGTGTGDYFSTGDIKDFERIIVTEVDNKLTLTKVPRINHGLGTKIFALVKGVVKCQGSNTLPITNPGESSRQNSSSSRRGQ